MCTELGRRRLAAVLCTVARPVSTCWGAGEAVVPSGSWLGWLAFGRLSAGVRCPKVAMTACSSIYRLSVSASCCGTGTWLACAFDFSLCSSRHLVGLGAAAVASVWLEV